MELKPYIYDFLHDILSWADTVFWEVVESVNVAMIKITQKHFVMRKCIGNYHRVVTHHRKSKPWQPNPQKPSAGKEGFGILGIQYFLGYPWIQHGSHNPVTIQKSNQQSLY